MDANSPFGKKLIFVLFVVAWNALVLGLAWYSKAYESELALGLSLLMLISPVILMALLVGKYGDGLGDGP